MPYVKCTVSSISVEPAPGNTNTSAVPGRTCRTRLVSGYRHCGVGDHRPTTPWSAWSRSTAPHRGRASRSTSSMVTDTPASTDHCVSPAFCGTQLRERPTGRSGRWVETRCPVIGHRSKLVPVEPLTAMGGVGGLQPLSRPHLSPSRDTPVGARLHRRLWRPPGFCHCGLPGAPCLVCRSFVHSSGPCPGRMFGVGRLRRGRSARSDERRPGVRHA